MTYAAAQVADSWMWVYMDHVSELLDEKCHRSCHLHIL